MKKFKITLAGLDEQIVPKWVTQEFVNNDINFVVYECKTREDLAKYGGDADVIWLFGGSKILKAENFSVIPRCGAVIRSGSGTDNVAVTEATRLGIIVSNTPGAISHDVAEHAIGLLFTIVRQIVSQDRGVRRAYGMLSWLTQDSIYKVKL